MTMNESRTPRWYRGALDTAKDISNSLKRRGKHLGAIVAIGSLGVSAQACDEPIVGCWDDCLDEPQADFVYMFGEDVPAGVGAPTEGEMYSFCVVDGQVLEDNTGLVEGFAPDNIDTCWRTITAGNVDGNANVDGEDVYETSNGMLEVTAAADPALIGARFWARVQALGADHEPASFKVGDAHYLAIDPSVSLADNSGLDARTGPGRDFVPGWRDWNGALHTSPDTIPIDGAPTETYRTFEELMESQTVTPYGPISREEAVTLVGEAALAAREAAFTPTIEDSRDTVWIAQTRIPAGYAVSETGEWGLLAASLELTLDDATRPQFQDATPGGEWEYVNAGTGVPFGAYNVMQKMDGEFEGQFMVNRAYIARSDGPEPTLIKGRENSGNATEAHLAVTQGVWATGVPGMFRQGAGARLSNGTESIATNNDLAATYNNTVSSSGPDHLRFPLAQTQGRSLSFWTELREDVIEEPARIVSREYVTEHGGQ